jgi:hypothetical protein
MKPAAAEAKKAQAMQAIADRLTIVEEKLDYVLAKIEALFDAVEAPEEPQVETPVEPEVEDPHEAITEPVPTVEKPTGRKSRG